MHILTSLYIYEIFTYLDEAQTINQTNQYRYVNQFYPSSITFRSGLGHIHWAQIAFNIFLMSKWLI